MINQKPNLEKTMEYNSYIGTVEFSAEDEILFGKIWGINDSITYEGESVEQLKEAFHEAVDDYLEFCMEIGKDPQRAYKGSFNVRVKPDIHKKAALEAEKKGVSLNQFVELSLLKALDLTSRSLNDVYTDTYRVKIISSSKFDKPEYRRIASKKRFYCSTKFIKDGSTIDNPKMPRKKSRELVVHDRE